MKYIHGYNPILVFLAFFEGGDTCVSKTGSLVSGTGSFVEVPIHFFFLVQGRHQNSLPSIPYFALHFNSFCVSVFPGVFLFTEGPVTQESVS